MPTGRERVLVGAEGMWNVVISNLRAGPESHSSSAMLLLMRKVQAVLLVSLMVSPLFAAAPGTSTNSPSGRATHSCSNFLDRVRVLPSTRTKAFYDTRKDDAAAFEAGQKAIGEVIELGRDLAGIVQGIRTNTPQTDLKMLLQAQEILTSSDGYCNQMLGIALSRGVSCIAMEGMMRRRIDPKILKEIMEGNAEIGGRRLAGIVKAVEADATQDLKGQLNTNTPSAFMMSIVPPPTNAASSSESQTRNVGSELMSRAMGAGKGDWMLSFESSLASAAGDAIAWHFGTAQLFEDCAAFAALLVPDKEHVPDKSIDDGRLGTWFNDAWAKQIAVDPKLSARLSPFTGKPYQKEDMYGTIGMFGQRQRQTPTDDLIGYLTRKPSRRARTDAAAPRAKASD